jgi:hypothetical protein
MGQPSEWTNGRYATSARVATVAVLMREVHQVNGKVIVPVRRGGVSGHVMRSRSGVKVAEFYGADSLERAIDRALRGATREQD